MKILALNCGSSTVKFQLFETSPELMRDNRDRSLARGIVERIGSQASGEARFESAQHRWSYEGAVHDHQHAIDLALDWLIHQSGALGSTQEIKAVGHRVVHAGEHYDQPVIIDDDVARVIADCAALAPLHNPHNLKGYEAIRRRLPGIPNVAVFDTAFHHSLPPHAYLYALPLELYHRHRIRRYGFHGTSHRYVAHRYAQLAGQPLEQLRLITCHLGSGSSICAIAQGQSVDTSMGFTPLEGLVMGTRPGDVDPGLLLELLRRRLYTLEELDETLHRRSGLLGLSGYSADVRTLLEQAAAGHERCRLALEVFAYRAKKYVGAYLAVLNGADALVFTGGIGEHAWPLRERICDGLDHLGLELDRERNCHVVGAEGEISTPGSPVKIWVIPTNEELLIAREACLAVLRAEAGPATSSHI